MTTQHEHGSVDTMEPRLHEVLYGQITLSPAEYTDGRAIHPTPLDPDNVVMANDGSWDYQTGISSNSPYLRTFRDYALEGAKSQIAYMSAMKMFSVETIELFATEAYAQIYNRADHNAHSFGRLKEALKARPPKDEGMLDIIYNARSGLASLIDELRLIKEYPEMVSIETSNTREIILSKDNNPIKAAMLMAQGLRDGFHDAVVTLGSSSPRKVSESQLVPGMIITKTVLAEIESADSHTQFVLKTAQYEHKGRVFNFGATTYFRTYDWAERRGYVTDEESDVQMDAEIDAISALPAEKARQLIGQLANGSSAN